MGGINLFHVFWEGDWTPINVGTKTAFFIFIPHIYGNSVSELDDIPLNQSVFSPSLSPKIFYITPVTTTKYHKPVMHQMELAHRMFTAKPLYSNCAKRLFFE